MRWRVWSRRCLHLEHSATSGIDRTEIESNRSRDRTDLPTNNDLLAECDGARGICSQDALAAPALPTGPGGTGEAELAHHPRRRVGVLRDLGEWRKIRVWP